LRYRQILVLALCFPISAPSPHCIANRSVLTAFSLTASSLTAFSLTAS
jgi:hypothetical protein